MLQDTYAKARRVHLVLNNLNIHFRKSFQDALGVRGAARLLHRVRFRSPPEHASWLNMTEIEIAILTRQCLDRRLPARTQLGDEVAAWHCSRNAQQKTIDLNFTRQDSDRKLARHYVPESTC